MSAISKMLSLLSICAASCFAQVKGISVRVTDQGQTDITYLVLNLSSETLTAYTLGVDTSYNDGTTEHWESGVRMKPAIAMPGASYEATLHDENHGGIAEIHLTPLVAIYADDSYEAIDSATYHRLANPVVAQRLALQLAIKAIQRSLADGTDPKPSIELALQNSRAATAGPYPGTKRQVAGQPIQPDDWTLEQILNELIAAKTTDDMTEYASKLRKRLKETQ